MRISDWSSDACSSDPAAGARMVVLSSGGQLAELAETWGATHVALPEVPMPRAAIGSVSIPPLMVLERVGLFPGAQQYVADAVEQLNRRRDKLIMDGRSEEHTSELQSLMRISYAVFCLKKKTQ